MLTARAVAATTVLVAIACGQSVDSAQQHSATRTTPPLPTPSIPANATVVEGGVTQMKLGRSRGTLDVSVEITRNARGTATGQVRYQRNGPCKPEAVGNGNSVVNCPVLWKERHDIAAGAFNLDPMLASASFSDKVRGKTVRITWTALRDTERQVNRNGYLLLETRDSVGDTRWGADHYVDPKSAQVPSVVFRRVPKPDTPGTP